MEKPTKHRGHEDELGANNPKDMKKVDSFKTGDKKQGRYYDQPFDEQMLDPESHADDDEQS